MGSLVVAFAVLVAGAPPSDGAGQLPLRLEKGQEFVYRGVYSETVNRPGQKVGRRFDLSAYVFILNQSANGTDAAFLTIQRSAKPDGVEVPIARMELGKVDDLGRVKFLRKCSQARVPPEGPPNLEARAFVELPAKGVSGGLTWETAEDGEGPMTWNVTGIDRDQPGGPCLKLIGRKQSQSWNRLATVGWKREDIVWLKLAGGYAVRIERKWENRDEGGDIGLTSLTVMELETYNPATLPPSEDLARRTEIAQTHRFADEFESLLQSPADRRGYAPLLAQIQTHVNVRARTPYRDAILTLRSNIEAARNGERPPEPVVLTSSRSPLDVGQPAPDLLLADAITGESVRLNRFQGRPVILLLFKPNSPLSRHVLAYADEANSAYAGKVQVVAMAVSGEPGAIVQLRAQLHVRMPIYDGREASRLFAGESTPRIVILDKAGTIHSLTPGWGGEYPERFGKELFGRKDDNKFPGLVQP
jgi:hypothetical protein